LYLPSFLTFLGANSGLGPSPFSDFSFGVLISNKAEYQNEDPMRGKPRELTNLWGGWMHSHIPSLTFVLPTLQQHDQSLGPLAAQMPKGYGKRSMFEEWA